MLQGNNEWYDRFIEVLYKKYPRKQDLVQVLLNELELEREAVYRRLRYEVSFTADEVATLAASCDFSLDDIIHIKPDTISFQMRKIDFVNPNEEEMVFLDKVVKGINYAKDFPSTEFMDVCNKLPRQILAGFHYLNKYYLFKWLFQYGKERDVTPFSKIVISNEQAALTKQYAKVVKLVPKTSFIFDSLLFNYLLSDIQYFCSIKMITEREKKYIKKDLLALLNYLQEIANMGCYPETQNTVSLFISHLHIDTNYNYVITPDVNICFVHVFDKMKLHTYNEEMATYFRTWMQFKKRSSTQISEVDERNRIEYFAKQRAMIETL